MEAIGDLARQTEQMLELIRSRKTVLTPDRVRLLLIATDRLGDLIRNSGSGNQAGLTQLMTAVGRPSGDRPPSAETTVDHASPRSRNEIRTGGMHLQVLLVEDDFDSRLLLQTFLSSYGECHIAVNGREAVEAVRFLLERGRKYDLICMDIMMPEMDGREAVRQVRALEEQHGIPSTYGAKIIMTTAVGDMKEVIRCFKELCDGYVIKPIDLVQLVNQMKFYRLIQ